MKKVILVIAFLLFAASLHAEEFAVIVNAAGPLKEISKADVREIYLGNMRFINGEAIMPVHYKEGPVKEAFLSSIVGMNSKEYRQYWIRKVFHEGISAPASQNSFQSILSSVRTTAGAIGYVSASELNEIKGVKIIATVKP